MTFCFSVFVRHLIMISFLLFSSVLYVSFISFLCLISDAYIYQVELYKFERQTYSDINFKVKHLNENKVKEMKSGKREEKLKTLSFFGSYGAALSLSLCLC